MEQGVIVRVTMMVLEMLIVAVVEANWLFWLSHNG